MIQTLRAGLGYFATACTNNFEDDIVHSHVAIRPQFERSFTMIIGTQLE